MKKLLKDMEGINNRKAQFRTVFALIIDGKEHLFEGIVKGEIAENKKALQASATIPYSFPKDIRRLCRNGNELKNKISHRALATAKLCRFLMK